MIEAIITLQTYFTHMFAASPLRIMQKVIAAENIPDFSVQ